MRIPDGPYRTNCLFWALLRWRKKGGYIAIRRSVHFRLVPHFVWSSRAMKYWWGYYPARPKDDCRAAIHAVMFRGKIELERRV